MFLPCPNYLNNERARKLFDRTGHVLKCLSVDLGITTPCTMESVTEKVLNQIDRSLQGQLSKVKRKYKRHMICFCVICNMTGSVRDLDAI